MNTLQVTLFFAILFTLCHAQQFVELKTNYENCGDKKTHVGTYSKIAPGNDTFFAVQLFDRPSNLKLAALSLIAKDLSNTMTLQIRKVVIEQAQYAAMDAEQRQALYQKHAPADGQFDFADILTPSAMFHLLDEQVVISSPLLYASVFTVRATANNTATFNAVAVAGDNQMLCDLDRQIQNLIIGCVLGGVALLCCVCGACICCCAACIYARNKNKPYQNVV